MMIKETVQNIIGDHQQMSQCAPSTKLPKTPRGLNSPENSNETVLRQVLLNQLALNPHHPQRSNGVWAPKKRHRTQEKLHIAQSCLFRRSPSTPKKKTYIKPSTQYISQSSK